MLVSTSFRRNTLSLLRPTFLIWLWSLQGGTVPDYRRARVPGGTYFFTVNLLERHPNDLLTRHVDILRDAVRRVRQRYPFHIDAWVLLPDHLHAIWTLPPGDDDYSGRWRFIKQCFSRGLYPVEYRSEVRQRRGERGIWQRRFWEHTIRDQRGFDQRFHYIHHNPVKHGFVQRPGDWPYSSFHRAVRQGIYPADWTAQAIEPFTLPPDEDD
jgi:putative transposase